MIRLKILSKKADIEVPIANGCPLVGGSLNKDTCNKNCIWSIEGKCLLYKVIEGYFKSKSK